jgi:hypothetical protein
MVEFKNEKSLLTEQNGNAKLLTPGEKPLNSAL